MPFLIGRTEKLFCAILVSAVICIGLLSCVIALVVKHHQAVHHTGGETTSGTTLESRTLATPVPVPSNASFKSPTTTSVKKSSETSHSTLPSNTSSSINTTVIPPTSPKNATKSQATVAPLSTSLKTSSKSPTSAKNVATSSTTTPAFTVTTMAHPLYHENKVLKGVLATLICVLIVLAACGGYKMWNKRRMRVFDYMPCLPPSGVQLEEFDNDGHLPGGTESFASIDTGRI